MPIRTVIVSATFLVAAFVLILWSEFKPDPVIESIEVGTGVSADHSPSAYGVSSTSVETTGGSFAVAGIFQLIKGNEMVFVVHESGKKKLCDQVQDVCNDIL